MLASKPPRPRREAPIRRRAPTIGGLLGAMVGLLLAGEARAENCRPKSGLSTCIDADQLWPHPGGGPFFAIGSTTTTPAGAFSFGLVGSLVERPIGISVASANPKGSSVYAVDSLVDASLLFAMGVTDRLELTLAAPVTLYQGGVGIQGVLGSSAATPRSAIRDLRFGLTMALLERSRIGVPSGPALTARLDFGVPTGTAGSFAGGASMVVAPTVVFDWRLGRVTLAAETGARLRQNVTLGDAVMGPQIEAALGGSVDILKDRWLTGGAEAFALVGTSGQLADPRDASAGKPPLVPAEWIVSASTAHFLAGDLVLSLGGGGTIPFSSRSAVTAPAYRLDFAVKLAPTGHDSDGDGVPDAIDKCPNEPEDRDGFQDADGCPDPDNDGDGIPDALDKCPNDPEDFDGFQDKDGCPDLDDDGDGIPDSEDKCRNEPEDFDGFEDKDGCPEPDNDHDGIPDKIDRCPNEPEDKDGFQDADGCPDLDNDGDGIPDALDQCPNEPEDFDGFEDKDGCPDPDNDQDGVPDALDKCPKEAETINGDRDDDGCPEPGAHSLVTWAGDRVVAEKLGGFAGGKSTASPALEKQLRMMAQLVRGRMPLGAVIIEVRPEGGTLKALELAGARAESVKKIFAASGIPEGVITAVAGDPGAKRAPRAQSIEVTATRAPRPRRSAPAEGRERSRP